jgi:hypothetical protein
MAVKTGDRGAQHAPQGNCADGDTQLTGRQRKMTRDKRNRACNHRDVEPEQKTADRCDQRYQVDVTPALHAAPHLMLLIHVSLPCLILLCLRLFSKGSEVPSGLDKRQNIFQRRVFG